MERSEEMNHQDTKDTKIFLLVSFVSWWFYFSSRNISAADCCEIAAFGDGFEPL